jgi:hypothetical protein
VASGSSRINESAVAVALALAMAVAAARVAMVVLHHQPLSSCGSSTSDKQ